MAIDKVKVLVVDNHIQFRWGMLEVLAREETLEVVEEASDGNEAIEKAKAVKPHVVLMDLNMPNCDGVEATRRLQAELPETNVLMLTVSESGTDLVDALKAGARGYLLKHEKPEQIIQAKHYITRGGLLISPSMITKLQKELGDRQPVEERADVAVHTEPATQTSPVTVQEETEPVQEITEERAEVVTEPPPERDATIDSPPNGGLWRTGIGSRRGDISSSGAETRLTAARVAAGGCKRGYRKDHITFRRNCGFEHRFPRSHSFATDAG